MISLLLSNPILMLVFGVLIILALTYTLHRLFPTRQYPKYIPSFIFLVLEIYFVINALPFGSRGWEGIAYIILSIVNLFVLLAGFISAKVLDR